MPTSQSSIRTQNSTFSTYTFTRRMQSHIKDTQTKLNPNSATTLGLHAENVIINALDRHPMARGSKTSIPNPKATAALQQAGKPGKLAQSVVDAAAQEAASQILALLERELQELDSKTYSLDQTGLAGSSVVGDIGIIVGGKRIVFESKFQTSRSNPTRWFGLASATLFGDDVFKEYLAMYGLYLHTIPAERWIPAVQTYLADFLNEYIGSPADQALFMIQKGHAIAQSSFDAKYVVHMMGAKGKVTSKIDVTITSMEELEERLSQAISRHDSMMYSLAQHDMVNTVAYTDSSGATLAQAGITNKTVEDYTIEFYIAQKLINAALQQ